MAAVGSPLLLRVMTGVVLAATAIAAVWFGGVLFTAFVALAVLLMFAEWAVMFRLGRTLRLVGLAVLALTIFAMNVAAVPEVMIALGGGAGLAFIFARRLQRRSAFWLASGILYCGLPAVALLWLRGQAHGLTWTLGLLVLVWATDIGAYFSGRAIGGPKFASAISPNKTWAGVAGGIATAVAVAFGYVWYLSSRSQFSIGTSLTLVFVGLAFGVAVVAVLGDLFESWLKRLAGVKDSGNLLPGHGGVLDRLDGLVPAAVLVAPLLFLLGMTGR